jgi:hypothetical protein
MSRAVATMGRVAALAAALMPALATAQEVRGVALDPYGQPIPGVVVALHRVGDMGAGANVASVTTDAEGRFEFRVEEADSALYFAAMRYEGSMYIGPAAMAGLERVTGYQLVADPAAEAGAVATALAGQGAGAAQPAAATRDGPAGAIAGDTALLVVGVLALAVAGMFMAAAPPYRRRRTRDAVLELATIEEELAAGPGNEERQRLLRRRQDLRGRLAPPA